MTALTNTLLPSSTGGTIRPFDPARDMKAVADLVEICFGDTLDPDGQLYLQQMRRAATDSRGWGWGDFQVRPPNLPNYGYTYIEDGQLIGNLSLIPFLHHNRRYYLIANVAVHPDYRRRGIGKQLTQRGLEHAQQKGAPAAWLQVREENLAAVNLYRSLGFGERARRTTWFSQKDFPTTPVSTALEITSPAVRDWEQQRAWLELLYPSELSWHFGIDLNDLRPGWLGVFRRFFRQVGIHQWGAFQAGRARGFLTRVSSPNYADSLWLASPPDDDEVIATLLRYARQHSSRRRALALDFPAGGAIQAIQSAGFYAHQTLVWMEKTLQGNR